MRCASVWKRAWRRSSRWSRRPPPSCSPGGSARIRARHGTARHGTGRAGFPCGTAPGDPQCHRRPRSAGQRHAAGAVPAGRAGCAAGRQASGRGRPGQAHPSQVLPEDGHRYRQDLGAAGVAGLAVAEQDGGTGGRGGRSALHPQLPDRRAGTDCLRTPAGRLPRQGDRWPARFRQLRRGTLCRTVHSRGTPRAGVRFRAWQHLHPGRDRPEGRRQWADRPVQLASARRRRRAVRPIPGR